MEIWTPPLIPEFRNVKEQFIWHLKKFCRFSIFCGRKAGISSVSNLGDEDIEEKMSRLGDDYLIGRAVETKLKYGQGLQNESLVDVSKVIAELSGGVTVTDITKEMTCSPIS